MKETYRNHQSRYEQKLKIMVFLTLIIHKSLPNRSNNKVYTRQTITAIIAKYINNIKQEGAIFSTKYTPHIFRHSKAMHLLENGAILEEIQDYLGHGSIDTTKIYAKYNIEQQKQALEKAPNNLTDSKLGRWHNDSSIIVF